LYTKSIVSTTFRIIVYIVTLSRITAWVKALKVKITNKATTTRIYYISFWIVNYVSIK